MSSSSGNTHWEDLVRRHGELAQRGVRFLDAGASGGVTGARHGSCFMVGGDREPYNAVKPLLEDFAVADGAFNVGPPGSGHFVKNVHSMIEFGMVQAIREALETLERYDSDLDLADVPQLGARLRSSGDGWWS